MKPMAATHMRAVNAPLDRPEWSFLAAGADTALMLADTRTDGRELGRRLGFVEGMALVGDGVEGDAVMPNDSMAMAMLDSVQMQTFPRYSELCLARLRLMTAFSSLQQVDGSACPSKIESPQRQAKE